MRRLHYSMAACNGGAHRSRWAACEQLCAALRRRPSRRRRRPKGPAIPDYNLPQVRQINQDIRQVWTDNNLSPSPPATDGEWCRRVYLDVLGRVPSVQELRDFVASKEADKKAKLVNKLLYDEAYIEEYARNWTTIWTNILIGRNGGTGTTAR